MTDLHRLSRINSGVGRGALGRSSRQTPSSILKIDLEGHQQFSADRWIISLD